MESHIPNEQGVKELLRPLEAEIKMLKGQIAGLAGEVETLRSHLRKAKLLPEGY